MRILVVDDNEDSRKLLVKQLRVFGHEITSAINGKEALSIALENPPDIIVTDILMPEMDGYELCMEWKLNRKLKNIPLVFYTATYTSDEDEKFALSMGADAFIRKPTELGVFLDILSGTIEKTSIQKPNTPSTISIEESRFLVSHNQRLLAKLFSKVAELEKEIIERKRIEKSLKESEEKFRQFFQNAQVYCYIVSLENIFLEVNDLVCKELGYTREDLIGRPIDILYAPESWPKINTLSSEWKQTGIIRGEELTVLTKTGQRRDVFLTVGAIKNQEGQIVSFITIQKDITELKEAQKKAQQIESLTQLNKAKNEMLSNVAHELKTPLQSIKGFIETLIEPDVKWSKQQQREFLEEANKEVDILNLLIRDLLDISRIESGKMRLEKQICEFKDILETTKGRLTILAASHQLEYNISPGLPSIYVDIVRIAQVISNLVDNATKFSPPGSHIIIGAAASAGDLIITVSDQGIGMSQETINNLFNRFYQAKQAIDIHNKGSGLGLSICRGIIEAHNGQIWVESQPGKGTTFHIKIPVVVQTDKT